MGTLVDDAVAGGTVKRRVAAALLIVSGGVVFVAQRDLRGRPAGEVRGSKLVWRIGSTNAVVAFAYLRWGRRSA